MKPNFPPLLRFCQTILTEDSYPGSTVIVDLDANSYDEFPLVTWTFLNNGQKDFGLWSGTLALTILCDAVDTETMLSHVYAQVHSWEGPDRGEMPGDMLGIETVRDLSVFDNVNAAIMNGKGIAQYNAQFGLLIRDYS